MGGNKVLIIALDGLDYDLVEKFDLKFLKQEEYGKVCINVEPYTPVVWASFVTGVPYSRSNLRKDILIRIAGIELSFRCPRKARDCVVWFLRKLEIRHAEVDWIKMRRTMFEEVHKARVMYPPWRKGSHSWIGAEYMKLLFSVVEGDMTEEEFLHHAWLLYSKQEEEFLRVLKGEEWRLLMLYNQVLDIISHLFRGNLTIMWETYALMEERVKNLLRIAGNNCLKLIISDHGMQVHDGGGTHTHEGFYSINRRMGLEGSRITDFYCVIMRVLQKP